MAYAMGAVRPFVADIGNQIGEKFAVPNIAGWRATAGDMGGHPAGLALDIQVGQDRIKGDAVALYVTQNAAALDVKYVMWQQRYWAPGKGWKSVPFLPGDKPGYDPNHLRHVHVSFLDVNGQAPKGIIPAAQNVIGDVIDFGAGVWRSATGTVKGTLDFASGAAGAGLGLAGSAAEAVLSPTQALGKLFDRGTWLRVLQVMGGAGLVVYGLVILAVSQGSGPAGNIASMIPMPQAQAAGAILKTASKVTKG